jgi:hypothetical protein
MRPLVVLALCVLVVCVPTAVGEEALPPAASLHVAVSPERLGGSTTISFGFTIAAGEQSLPPALTVLNVGLPAGMGVDLGGLRPCSESALLAHGRSGCSANSQVGSGSVVVRVPLGNVIRTENAALTVFDGPRRGGHTTLLFFAAGSLPIATRLVFPGVILANAREPHIEALIPLIPTLPEAPDAAIVAMDSTIGTLQRRYYRTVGGRRESIAPKGATLPANCPSGGFSFFASFAFGNGAGATAAAHVECPR